jgi:DNA ligase-1
MKQFASLYTALETTTRTNEKVAVMARYFTEAEPADAAWALYFLSGRKPRQGVPAPKMASWAMEMANLPAWLFSESYDAVGDLAETIALLIEDRADAAPHDEDRSLHAWIDEVILPLRGMTEKEQRRVIAGAWSSMNQQERLVFNKLITGAFRVGVSQQLVVRALAQMSGIDDAVIAHRLMGEWQPAPAFYAQLIATETEDADISRPYPFFLAHPIEERLKDYEIKQAASLHEFLGDIHDWQAEWKWDGIRAQIIRRAGHAFVWSRGEENITERFPEITAMGDALPDGTVIDGEVLPFKEGRVLPFAQLQLRIGRKTVSKKLLADVPVVLMAYDLLEWQGEDARSRPLTWRREQLMKIVSLLGLPALMLSPLAEADDWAGLIALREESRSRNAEGLMLKRKADAYGVGRVAGSWWKWKINPFTVDAVLIYAQRGHGKRASLYTDYTFGVWNDEHTELVSFAKAYSGLTDAEIDEVDAFVRQNTVEKFGPVRTVTPALVFELAFEGIQRSSRHKSGIAVRFPRILRWRRDKPINEADSVATIRALLPE